MGQRVGDARSEVLRPSVRELGGVVGDGVQGGWSGTGRPVDFTCGAAAAERAVGGMWVGALAE